MFQYFFFVRDLLSQNLFGDEEHFFVENFPSWHRKFGIFASEVTIPSSSLCEPGMGNVS